MLDELLKLQELDVQIRGCREREAEIPKQKNKFDIYRERLKTELEEREKVVTELKLDQRDCEGAIDQHQAKIEKYNIQLSSVKKNDEFQALLHEIDQEKKQIGLREERILYILEEVEQAQARLDEDKKRISEETADIDRQCAEIDAELTEAESVRKELEQQRVPLIDAVDDALYKRYEKVRGNLPDASVVVPMINEVCTGCHMRIRAQIVNEVLEGAKVHGCQYCHRILYHPENVSEASLKQRVQAG